MLIKQKFLRNSINKKVILIIIILFFIFLIIYLSRPFITQYNDPHGQELYKKELSNELKNKLDNYILNSKIDSVTINDNKQTLYEYGNVEKSTNLALVRKSIISLLYGIAIEKKLIDINKTLKELNIDESKYKLTETEKSATIKDLLMARSGVYLESGVESEGMKNRRPKREEYIPGEYYYYNNWDFNVLGYIFEQETNLTIGIALNNWIGKKIGFQDFNENHIIYSKESASDYPTWRIYMSNRDLAKIGSLLLNEGEWNNKSIINQGWLNESTDNYSKTPYDNIEYGYLWWINKERNFFYGVGSAGQFLIVDKNNNLTFSIRKDSGVSILGMLKYRYFDNEVTNKEAFRFYDLFVENYKK